MKEVDLTYIVRGKALCVSVQSFAEFNLKKERPKSVIERPNPEAKKNIVDNLQRWSGRV